MVNNLVFGGSNCDYLIFITIFASDYQNIEYYGFESIY